MTEDGVTEDGVIEKGVVENGEVIAPGEVVAARRAVRVGTATGAVQLDMVQPHGRRPMAAADWARGVRIEPGEVLGDE